MRNNPRHENFDQMRQRLLDETGRFIEWGLRHPEQVEWIPKHPVGRGQFNERVKSIFWGLILNRTDWPD